MPSALQHNGFLWVYVNGKCNFRCKYCLDDRYAIPGRLEDHQDFIPQLKKLQQDLQYSLILTGGEPMLAPNTVRMIFEQFADVPKTVQTNGALTSATVGMAELLRDHDWISVSYHDYAQRKPAFETSIQQTVSELRKLGKNVLVQLMSTPQNIDDMLGRAKSFRDIGCKVVLRRIFEHSSGDYGDRFDSIKKASTESWAVNSFYESRWGERPQPFLAANVYLDGTIGFVCREEVIIGNLYEGYDLNLLESHRREICDQVCQCCTCLWAERSWGFA